MPRLYLETTIISYLTARPSGDLVTAAHQRITARWWVTRRDAFALHVSELVLREAEAGDPDFAARRLGLAAGLPVLALTPEAAALADRIVRATGLPGRAAADALHIAVSAVHGMDFLLTWNCRHIANAALRGRIEAACREHGYAAPVLCTPEELLGEEGTDD
jgi:hypothetical protein